MKIVSTLAAIVLVVLGTSAWIQNAPSASEPSEVQTASTDPTSGLDHASSSVPDTRAAVPVPAASPALTQHPVTVYETSPDLRIDPIPNAKMGKPIPRSALADQPGYALPEDRERDSIERGRRVAPLVDGHLSSPATSSLASLIQEILAGLHAGDGAHLESLGITYEEWLRLCWPEFPESRPAPQVRPEEAYFFMQRTSSAGVGRGLSEFASLDLIPVRVRCEPGVFRYANFNLYHDLEIFATPRNGDGPTVRIGFVKSVIERNGMWKVFSYADQE